MSAPLPQPDQLLPNADGPLVLAPAGEIDLIGFALFLLRHLRFILGCGLTAFLLMVVAMLLAKPRYASTAVMLIPQTSSSTSSLKDQLTAGTLDILGSGYEMYADILKSRTVADRVINDNRLLAVYHTTNMEYAEGDLAAMTSIQTFREGMIKVTVEDTSAQRAADLANDYLHQLDALNSSLVLSTAGSQRLFIERELVKEKDALADAEVALKQVQESHSGLAPQAEASAGISALEMTRASLRASQIRLASLLTSETDANPEVIRLRTEIAGLAGQLQSLERGPDSATNGVPTSQVPAQALEFTRREREVKFHETLFSLLERQYESAKEQELKTPSIVQILDTAVPALHKAWPPRIFYCLLAAIAGIFLGIVMLCVRAFFRAFMAVAENRRRFEDLVAVYRPARRGRA